MAQSHQNTAQNQNRHLSNSSPRESTTTSSMIPTLATVLGEALEVCVHELLYIRSVYPREIYVSTRYLGVRCHSARHVELCSYIVNTLDVAIPALCSGAADRLSLVILDGKNVSQEQDGDRSGIVESFIFEFDSIALGQAAASSVSKIAWSTRMVHELERGLRNLVLKIISLEVQTNVPLSPDATFKLRLHTVDRRNQCKSNSNPEREVVIPTCDELEQAMKGGKWFQPNDHKDDQASSQHNNDGNNSRYVTRPLKHVNVPSCGLRMQLLSESKYSM